MSQLHTSATGLKRSELSAATGCNLETIRYYEGIGVLPEPPRTAKGHRAYGASHVARLKFVMRSRELGFSLDQVRELLEMVDRGVQTCAEVHRRTAAHLGDVRSKIADLKRIEHVLSDTLAKCSEAEVPDCPVVDALSGVGA